MKLLVNASPLVQDKQWGSKEVPISGSLPLIHKPTVSLRRLQMLVLCLLVLLSFSYASLVVTTIFFAHWILKGVYMIYSAIGALLVSLLALLLCRFLEHRAGDNVQSYLDILRRGFASGALLESEYSRLDAAGRRFLAGMVAYSGLHCSSFYIIADYMIRTDLPSVAHYVVLTGANVFFVTAFCAYWMPKIQRLFGCLTAMAAGVLTASDV